MKLGDLVSVRTELRTARGIMHMDQIGIFMGYVNYPMGRMVKVLVSAGGENMLGEHPEDKIIPVADQPAIEWGKWKTTCTPRPVAL